MGEHYIAKVAQKIRESGSLFLMHVKFVPLGHLKVKNVLLHLTGEKGEPEIGSINVGDTILFSCLKADSKWLIALDPRRGTPPATEEGKTKAANDDSYESLHAEIQAICKAGMSHQLLLSSLLEAVYAKPSSETPQKKVRWGQAPVVALCEEGPRHRRGQQRETCHSGRPTGPHPGANTIVQ